MFGKLLKNELKAGLHYITLVYIAAAGILLTCVLSLVFKIMWLTALTSLAVMLVAVGILIATTVFIIARFYRSLFRDQGYLTFTLPVTSGQILTAKSICSFFWLLISYISCFALIFFGTLSFSSLVEEEMGEELLWELKTIASMFVELPNKSAIYTSIALVFLDFFLRLVFFIALIFFSMTLSNVRPFQGLGFLSAVLIFVVLFIVTSIISTLLNIFSPVSIVVTLSKGLQLVWEQPSSDTMFGYGVADRLFKLVCTFFFFGFSGWLMNHKINLK